MDMFGLGILLNAKDNASQSILRVSASLQGLNEMLVESGNMSERQMERVTNAMQNAEKELNQGMLLSNLGQQISSLGERMIKPIKDIGMAVIGTGAKFEEWRMTLKALYKDSSLAEDKLNWAVDLAAKTPFEIQNLVQSLIGFKAIGVDADKTFANANGEMRTFLEYMGDLGALRPDVGLQGIMMGVRNLLGGDKGRSLRMRMDIDFQQILGRDWGSNPEQIMKDLVEASDKLANGLMKELEGTWNQIISNMKDQTTRFLKAISDNGGFKPFKDIMQSLGETIASIDDETMAKIGTNIGKSLEMIIKPFSVLANLFNKLFLWVSQLLATHPFIAKLIFGLLSVGGAVLMLAGNILVVNGLIKVWKASISLIMPVLTTLKFTLMSVMPQLLLFSSLLTILYLSWKHNLGGFKDNAISFYKTIKNAFTESSQISKLSVDEMMVHIRRLSMSDKWFDKLLLALVKLRVFWVGLVDAWNDYELSDENYQKLKELGLLPLISTLLDLKRISEEVWSGFKKGIAEFWTTTEPFWKFMGEAIMWVCDQLNELVKWITGSRDEAEEDIDMTTWEKVGRVLGWLLPLVTGLGLAFLLLSNPINLWITLGVLLVASIVWVAKNWETIWGKVGEFFKKIGDGIKNMWVDLVNGCVDGVNKLIKAINKIPLVNIPEIPRIATEIDNLQNTGAFTGLNTGGYTKADGVAMLHKDEVVVNSQLTKKLAQFLGANPSSTAPSSTPLGGNSSSIDNSVTFSEGAIQITLTKGDEADAENLARKIIEKIKRDKELKDTMNYRPHFA